MNELKVPVAYDEGRNIIGPDIAEKGKRYFCPACGDSLIFKHGQIMTAHFAHRPSTICSQETITHKAAKLLIQKSIMDWKAGLSSAPQIQRQCHLCRKFFWQCVPDKVTGAELEVRLPDNHVVDIALLSNNAPIAAIEIFVTHLVDRDKATKLSIPYIELAGKDVLDNPLEWNPMSDKLNEFTCKECKNAITRFNATVRKISNDTHIGIPKSYYRYAPYKCWKCKKDIIVFWWPVEYRDDVPIEELCRPKETPIPKTIQYRFTKSSKIKKWCNVCPYCGQVQGNSFVYDDRNPLSAGNMLEIALAWGKQK